VSKPRISSESLWPYRRAVAAEALRGVGQFVRDHLWWEFLFIGMVLGVSYWRQDKSHPVERAVEALIPTAMVLGLAVVAVAVWQLVDSPARLLRVAEEKAGGPEGALHLTNAEKVEIIEEADGGRRVKLERAANIRLEKPEA